MATRTMPPPFSIASIREGIAAALASYPSWPRSFANVCASAAAACLIVAITVRQSESWHPNAKWTGQQNPDSPGLPNLFRPSVYDPQLASTSPTRPTTIPADLAPRQLHGPTRACRSSSSKDPSVPAAPAMSECPSPPPTNAWQKNGGAYGTLPASQRRTATPPPSSPAAPRSRANGAFAVRQCLHRDRYSSPETPTATPMIATPPEAYVPRRSEAPHVPLRP